MYICICNQVRDHHIVDAVRAGARDLDDLRCQLDVASCCGKCADDARQVIDRTLMGDQAVAAASPVMCYDATA